MKEMREAEENFRAFPSSKLATTPLITIIVIIVDIKQIYHALLNRAVTIEWFATRVLDRIIY